MTPTLAAKAFLVMAAFWAYGYSAKPSTPVAPLATPPADPNNARSKP